MPKGRVRRSVGVRKRGNVRSITGVTTIVPFRLRVATSFSANAGTTIASVDLTALTLGTRIAQISDNFEFFRLKGLRVYQTTTSVASIHDGSMKVGLIQADHAIAYTPDAVANVTAPTDETLMSQMECYKHGNVFDRLSFKVPDREVGVSFKWYHTTNTGTIDISERSVGSLWFCAQNAVSTDSPGQCRAIVEGVCEFKGMVDPADSFKRKPCVFPPFQPEDTKSEVSNEDDVVDVEATSRLGSETARTEMRSVRLQDLRKLLGVKLDQAVSSGLLHPRASSNASLMFDKKVPSSS